eukprot:TRINITY_DN1279_c0_g2_i2.p1 TRINITY_DN1279_c0_g2~~TRINITY_DN1279_c0_g2_i2.p1  ORF type:complete len:699 (+),score=104.07 TRINITY_DN1279_c0_g2_i2:69-2165(+)
MRVTLVVLQLIICVVFLNTSLGTRNSENSASTLFTDSSGSPDKGGNKSSSGVLGGFGIVGKALARKPSFVRTNKRESNEVGYVEQTLRFLRQWFEDSKPWGDGCVPTKLSFFVVVFLVLFAPPLAYFSLKEFVDAVFDPTIRENLRWSLIACVWLVSWMLAITALTRDEDETENRLQLMDDLSYIMSAAIALVIVQSLWQMLHHLDNRLYQHASRRVESTDYQKKRRLMNSIEFGTRVVAPTHDDREHTMKLYQYVWTPFRYGSKVIMALFVLLLLTGQSTEAFLLVGGYVSLSVILGVFGGKTLGPEIYSLCIILIEKHFDVGDIITIDNSSSSGGANTDIQKSLCTGFVEAIGIRSVLVRRFDMRLVRVPNSKVVNNVVANWSSRPRKCINLRFNVQVRAPVPVLDSFSSAVKHFLVNDPGVDEQQYLKAIFRAVNDGLNYQIVAFTRPEFPKKVVQQRVLFGILELAKKHGIEITFSETSMHLFREEVEPGGFILGECGIPVEIQKALVDGTFDLTDTLPKKKEKDTTKPIFCAPGMIIVKVKEVALLTAIAKKSFPRKVHKDLFTVTVQTRDTADAPWSKGRKSRSVVFTPDKNSAEETSTLAFNEGVGIKLYLGSELPREVRLVFGCSEKGRLGLRHLQLFVTNPVDIAQAAERTREEEPLQEELLTQKGVKVGHASLRVHIPDPNPPKKMKE